MIPIMQFFSASGLMIASRYPILEAEFYACKYKRSFWQQAICYGIIMAKVDLGQGNVGYISNLHNVAYQGTVGNRHHFWHISETKYDSFFFLRNFLG